MEEKKKSGSSIGGVVFIGCMFIGAGLGLLMGKVAVGGSIGLGVGFIAMAGIWAYYRDK